MSSYYKEKCHRYNTKAMFKVEKVANYITFTDIGTNVFATKLFLDYVTAENGSKSNCLFIEDIYLWCLYERLLKIYDPLTSMAICRGITPQMMEKCIFVYTFPVGYIDKAKVPNIPYILSYVDNNGSISYKGNIAIFELATHTFDIAAVRDSTINNLENGIIGTNKRGAYHDN
jgi:hypothetical protein